MSIEAFWSVRFVSDIDHSGGGVVFLKDGRVLGGDSQYTYMGDYSTSGDIFSATIRASLFNGQPNSIAGQLQSFNVKVSGKANENTMELEGTLSDHFVRAIMVRRAELP